MTDETVVKQVHVTYTVVGRLFWLLSNEKIKLSTKQVAVLTVLAACTDRETMTTSARQGAHARIAGMSGPTLRATLKTLIPEYLEPVGHREHGVVRYRLKLDGLTPSFELRPEDDEPEPESPTESGPTANHVMFRQLAAQRAADRAATN